MKKAALFGFIAIALSSCFNDEDPGPIQAQTKEYSITDFDRIEASDALHVTVRQGSNYSVKVEGDRRNIDDLEVSKFDNTLRLKFDNDGNTWNRQYATYITITLPMSDHLGIKLSGAVKASVNGSVTTYNAEVSGASELNAFELQAEIATIEASGASKAEVLVTQKLKANASGASKIRYRGNPVVIANASGASSIGID